VTKLQASHRIPLVAALLALVAAGCSKDAAQPWHYWIAPLLVLSALFIVFVAMPLGYYIKVYRLKHRGR
jgi:NADH:ubiquinone oxidoreductase subunit H